MSKDISSLLLAGISPVTNKASLGFHFFHAPTVVLHGSVPYTTPDAYLFRRFVERTCFPFAFLTADVPSAMPRLLAMEAALAQPGRSGLVALLALKTDTRALLSSLVSAEGLPALTDANVPQHGVPMETRRQMLDVGEWLTTTRTFASLAPAEAAVLGTFMERLDVSMGDLIIHQGQVGDGLFIIETGQAAVEARDHAGRRVRLATRGPSETLGEIALVTGGERTADVVALTPMRLLKLTTENYGHYLARMIEVERQLAQTAAIRATETAQRLSSSSG